MRWRRARLVAPNVSEQFRAVGNRMTARQADARPEPHLILRPRGSGLSAERMPPHRGWRLQPGPAADNQEYMAEPGADWDRLQVPRQLQPRDQHYQR